MYQQCTFRDGYPGRRDVSWPFYMSAQRWLEQRGSIPFREITKSRYWCVIGYVKVWKSLFFKKKKGCWKFLLKLTYLNLVDQHLHSIFRNDYVSYYGKYWRLNQAVHGQCYLLHILLRGQYHRALLIQREWGPKVHIWNHCHAGSVLCRNFLTSCIRDLRRCNEQEENCFCWERRCRSARYFGSFAGHAGVVGSDRWRRPLLPIFLLAKQIEFGIKCHCQ